jgi:PPOX class probable F420-dependent enzyme
MSAGAPRIFANLDVGRNKLRKMRGISMSRRTTLTNAETAFVLRQRAARLATADTAGNPHVIPCCYAFDGTRFYTPLDEKPKRVEYRQLRRVRNIEARPTVALVIDQYDDDWSRLGYVLIQGQAELLSPNNDEHARALVLLRERYVQYRTMALENYPVIAITPEQITSWGPAIMNGLDVKRKKLHGQPSP